MKLTILYSMNGCPHCDHINEEFKKNKINFIDRDIYEHESEYDDFSKIVDNEYVPALLLMTLDENKVAHNVKYLSPDKDYNDIHEGVEIVKNYLLD